MMNKQLFFSAIAMKAEQDNTDYGSRGWQIEKLQRVKLRDLQPNNLLLKEVCSWVLNEKIPEPLVLM